LTFPVKGAPSLLRCRPPQTIVRSIETGKAEQVREEAEFSFAMQTGCVLKENELSTNARVGFHREPTLDIAILSPLEGLALQDDT